MSPPVAGEVKRPPRFDGPFQGLVVGVVIVSYNSAAVLPSCLAALSVASDAAADRWGIVTRLVVVDNASASSVSAEGAQVIQLDRNLGFAMAANVGIEHVGAAAFVLFLNPDARLEPDALSELLGAFRVPGTAIAGPALVSDDGVPMPSERPFHSLRRELAHQLLPIRPRDVPRADRARCLTGACLLVDLAFLCEVGGLDETLRMYLEDVELCWAAHERGRRVAYVGDAVCRHHLGGSSGGVDFRHTLELRQTLLAARIEFLRRRSGAIAAGCMRALIAAGALARMPLRMRRRALHEQAAIAVWAITSGRPPDWDEFARW